MVSDDSSVSQHLQKDYDALKQKYERVLQELKQTDMVAATTEVEAKWASAVAAAQAEVEAAKAAVQAEIEAAVAAAKTEAEAEVEENQTQWANR